MKVACVQRDVCFGNPAANVEAALSELRRLSNEGVDLAVFPEAFLTGYCADSVEDARGMVIQHDSPEIETLRAACDGFGVTAIVGFAERLENRLFNSAALLEPMQEPRFYRKSHLPDMGLDKFVQPGEELKVFDTKIGRLGILICFDLRAPEAARVLALQGAEIIALCTNWPEGAEVSAHHISIARAAESRVFLATCNRVGEEKGFRFIGGSKIIDPTGKVLAAAGAETQTIHADIDLDTARTKRTVTIPGKYETDVFASRRPELYGPLVHPLEKALAD